MSGLRNMASKGWHPKGDKSVRQMITRRGGGTESRDYSSHSAAPLSTLKDPASFGPPPKHVAVHGPQSGPGGNPDSYQKRTVESPTYEESPPLPSKPSHTTPDPPPQPPSRRDTPSSAGGGGPRLPPRLPPRQNSHPDINSPAPPPTYDQATGEASDADSGYINTQAADRLGKAGVSVPGLDIGAQGTAASRPPPPRQPAAPSSPGQMNELQARFARMGRTESFDDDTKQQSGGDAPSSQPVATASAAAAAAASKKPKPPPPRKKPGLSASAPVEDSTQGAPPPIPLSSKPRPS